MGSLKLIDQSQAGTIASVLAGMLFLQPGPFLADGVSNGQWYAKALGLAEVHRLALGSGVVVAVIDSGVDAAHPTISGRVISGADFSNGDATSIGDGLTDTDGHGTGMASLIAGHGRIAGVAPEAVILPIRVQAGSETVSSGNGIAMAAALDWAVGHGADIISISLTVPIGDPRERAAIDRAIESDVLVVASAGNAPGAGNVQYPARYPGVLAVCATDSANRHSEISVIGPELSICAPGVNVSRAAAEGKYALASGTSDSAALIAGAAALIRSAHPELGASDVARRLTLTATDEGAIGKDDLYGYGVIDLPAAMAANLSPADSSLSSVSDNSEKGTPNWKAFQLVFWLFACVVLLALLGVGILVGIRLHRSKR